jgi:hypothetical protein
VIRTDDLFLGGFALARGGELVGVELRGTNGRRVAVFAIEGAAALAAERDYYRGTTSVDLQLLKLQIRRLKDAAFDAIREEERRSRDAGEQGRNREDQGGERPRRGPR